MQLVAGVAGIEVGRSLDAVVTTTDAVEAAIAAVKRLVVRQSGSGCRHLVVAGTAVIDKILVAAVVVRNAINLRTLITSLIGLR